MRMPSFSIVVVVLMMLVVAPRASAQAEHRNFDEFLQRYVGPTGLVDYVGTRRDSTLLQSYVASLQSVDLKSLDRDERLATLINAYNAFTIQLIKENYPLKSIKDIPEEKRWKAVRWNIGGKTYSLDQIENDLIRPKFNEPRIHFALVCAARDCPPLRAEAYTAARLEAQLTDQMARTHANGSTWVSFDAASNTLAITPLYDWFKQDFLATAPSVEAYVAQYTPEVKTALDAGAKLTIEYKGYDWSLNESR
jgi:hypothetical protein